MTTNMQTVKGAVFLEPHGEIDPLFGIILNQWILYKGEPEVGDKAEIAPGIRVIVVSVSEAAGLRKGEKDIVVGFIKDTDFSDKMISETLVQDHGWDVIHGPLELYLLWERRIPAIIPIV